MLELFFPSFCLGCQIEGALLCSDCQATLDINEHVYCLCNKNPLRLSPQSNQGTCDRCRNKKLAGLYNALPYQEKFLTRKLIYQFKYEPHLIKKLAEPIADILFEHLIKINKNIQETWENSLLVPVPMDIKKQKHRGYTQTQELAFQLGQKLNVLSNFDNLIKIKPTLPQMKLSAKDRQENVQGAFIIKNPEKFSGEKIFLIDDVYTTGSTMEECARVLRAAGAKTVWGLAIAREG